MNCRDTHLRYQFPIFHLVIFFEFAFNPHISIAPAFGGIALLYPYDILSY